MVDAIVRTLWRLGVTRKRLLEWMTAEQAAGRAELSLAGFYRWMGLSVGVAVLGAVIAFSGAFATGLISLPFVMAWCAAPALVWQASRERQNAAIAALNPTDARKLRLIARQTWRFFETFVTAEENWLPPDNFQEGPPQSVVAHRTSPTNIGLYLLSVVAARDFGWLGLADAVDRLEATFATMRTMFRFRGHYYNWYDTRDLRPLDPQYVSSVDSGNLAGHLISLANACDAAAREASSNARSRQGIDDGIWLTRAALSESSGAAAEISAALGRLAYAAQEVQPGKEGLRTLESTADEVVDVARQHTVSPGHEDAVLVWAEATRRSGASAGTRRAASGYRPVGAGDRRPDGFSISHGPRTAPHVDRIRDVRKSS
jgi:cyclic beta-1,2-glucan synthetase